MEDQDGDSNRSAAESDGPVDVLRDSAARWIDRALGDWVNVDLTGVATHAPLAVEHLAKAVLWQRSPTLLVPLARDNETSLIALALAPNLSDPDLRTIGLRDALSRLVRVVSANPPIDDQRRRRLVAARNGAMHVGSASADVTRHVLTDALRLCNWLLPELDGSAEDFYGDNLTHVTGLLSQYRSELEEQVALRIARADRRFRELNDHIDDDQSWNALMIEREICLGEDQEEIRERGALSVKLDCPACEHEGLLIGSPALDPADESDLAVDGRPKPTPSLYLRPQRFDCKVCRLKLHGPGELEAAGVPADLRNLTADELRGFDAEGWVERRRSILADFGEELDEDDYYEGSV